jgi:hypothetical protein
MGATSSKANVESAATSLGRALLMDLARLLQHVRAEIYCKIRHASFALLQIDSTLTGRNAPPPHTGLPQSPGKEHSRLHQIKALGSIVLHYYLTSWTFDSDTTSLHFNGDVLWDNNLTGCLKESHRNLSATLSSNLKELLEME